MYSINIKGRVKGFLYKMKKRIDNDTCSAIMPDMDKIYPYLELYMSKKQIVPGLEKGMIALEYISRHPKGVAFGELLSNLPITRTTLFRILKTFEKIGCVVRQDRLYTLSGRVVFRTGFDNAVFRKTALPYLKNIIKESGGTAEAAVYEKQRILYIAKLESPDSAARMLFNEWEYHTHMHASGIGKVMLAFLPEQEIDAVIERFGLKAYTERTITDAGNLKKHLKNIRKQGGCVEYEENRVGVKRISAPVVCNGELAGAIGCVGLMSDVISRKQDREMLEKVIGCARKISNVIKEKMK